MKHIKISLFIATGGILIMSLFGFLKHGEADTVIYRLTWFELEITPFIYRFSIIPEQPILIGLSSSNEEKGKTMLIRYENDPEGYENVREKVDNLVKVSGVLTLKQENSKLVFGDGYDEKPAVHIRIAYADGLRWAGVYDIDEIPDKVKKLIENTKSLARQIMQEQSTTIIDGDTAETYLKIEQNAAQKDSPKIIVKIKVSRSGQVSVNGKDISLPDLGDILDDLKAKNGAVWYYRELPDEEPSKSANRIIKLVLDAITSRNLPISLQSEEF